MKMKKAIAIWMVMALLLAAGCAKKAAEAPVNQTVSAAPAAPAVSQATEAPAKPAPTCPYCLEEIKEGATRCPHCAGDILAYKK